MPENTDWDAEKARFVAEVYPPALKKVTRAFRRWPEGKRDDAIHEAMGKVWATWHATILAGKDPFAIKYPIIHWAIKWVEYDRKIAGRSPNGPDVQDYRAGMQRHDMDRDGGAHTAEESSRDNMFIPFNKSKDNRNPADEAALNVDFLAWIESLGEVDRLIVEELGDGPKQIARRYGVSLEHVQFLIDQILKYLGDD